VIPYFFEPLALVPLLVTDFFFTVTAAALDPPAARGRFDFAGAPSSFNIWEKYQY
jgi:hypothetical protein